MDLGTAYLLRDQVYVPGIGSATALQPHSLGDDFEADLELGYWQLIAADGEDAVPAEDLLELQTAVADLQTEGSGRAATVEVLAGDLQAVETVQGLHDNELKPGLKDYGPGKPAQAVSPQGLRTLSRRPAAYRPGMWTSTSCRSPARA